MTIIHYSYELNTAELMAVTNKVKDYKWHSFRQVRPTKLLGLCILTDPQSDFTLPDIIFLNLNHYPKIHSHRCL